MTQQTNTMLPPGQQWVAPDKWPTVGERMPRSDDAPWRVCVGGAVGRPCTFSLEALHASPQVERTIDIHCVTRWSKPGVRFSGVPLRVLVECARPDSAARFVSFVARSEHSHSTSLRLEEAMDLDPLVALRVDGSVLPREHGGPVRMVVPDRYFYKSLKWLERIELTSEDRLGFWESTAGYHNGADPWREQRYIAGELTRTEARAILQRRDVAGRRLQGLRVAGLDLARLHAAGATLRDADFRDCNLRGACFDGANLTNARFGRADLRGASFGDADLEGADFSAADLRGASLLGARLLAASFLDAAGTATDRPARIDRTTRVEPAACDQLTPLQQAFLLAAIKQDDAE